MRIVRNTLAQHMYECPQNESGGVVAEIEPGHILVLYEEHMWEEEIAGSRSYRKEVLRSWLVFFEGKFGGVCNLPQGFKTITDFAS